ncbi:hypothetical protein [Gaoshiqia sp. Z1-71]|uniref:hypothetical protein n=1 Tax=Gaoshiqia hydrogeniformans TaxID=3290090 RepID=UPI003BF804AF
MKQFISIAAIGIMALLFCGTETSAQIVVPEKPVPPANFMETPPKPGHNYVLVPVNWIWSRQQKMYLWVGSTWVQAPEDKRWTAGYWKEMPKGWKWVPGRWAKAEKTGWFLFKS